jgi:hypothetical protein
MTIICCSIFSFMFSAFKGDLAIYLTHYSHIYPRGLLEESFKMIFLKKKMGPQLHIYINVNSNVLKGTQ